MTSPSDNAHSAQVANLYLQNHDWIKQWITRRLGNASDAAELTHDVFVRLLAQPRSFDSDQHARAYLSRVSRHLCIDFWRRRQLEQAWLEALQQRPDLRAPSEEHQAIVIETLLQLQTMLQRLPDKVAEAFGLSLLEGLGYREIGERLGVSERMVTKYMAQAMFQCALLQAELDGALR
ncbi:sigma-70 family RNA polymerase sigma factor [Pseudomonas sp. 21LCFQ02]|uniref:sigma-70 family RNA polymerase sigma factor n=1 Tax=unclassified Pseudomonas TaxID=196821 RepID=UPI0004F5DC29|nr:MULTISPECIES: sigma-70 family RNA polymerase sigma factor [unclassified Pseudomonas]MCO8170866.1 sigma-70 family RNA polymerase sigma factor [Pseudomonas sp. 21LCFQ02]BAP43226.1 FecI family ECF sigma factor [Pseudomonas sp. StFLB209]